jgi:molybdenum cofactor synthesis domain-containing protein
MKKAEIITVGDEILSGDTLDTNSKWLCERLTELGIQVERINIVHDDIEQISKVILMSLRSDNNYTIVSGGLGPTHDDVTIEAVANALCREIKVDGEVLKWVEKKVESISKLGLAKNIDIEKLAEKPEGMIPIYNRVGMAPGLFEHHGERTLIVLPGVPRELECVFNDISDRIRSDETIASEELKIYGLEADLVDCFDEFRKKFPDVRLGSYPRGGIVRIKLYLHGKDEEEVKKKLLEAKEWLSTMIGES